MRIQIEQPAIGKKLTLLPVVLVRPKTELKIEIQEDEDAALVAEMLARELHRLRWQLPPCKRMRIEDVFFGRAQGMHNETASV